LQLDSNINIGTDADADEGLGADLELTIETTAEVDALAEAETEESNPDPFDAGLADVDKIMKRYENQDLDKELNTKKMCLGQDTKGGIDSIAQSNSKHNQPSDDKYIREIFDGYATGDKNQYGVPNGGRIITKWNAQLAAEDVIKNWNDLSQGALEKFFKDNFNKSWKKFDMYERGSIPDTEEVYFARDLMNALAPPDKEDPYALDFSEKKMKEIQVDPLVEPDYPVMERPMDHTKTKSNKVNSESSTTGKTNSTKPAAPASNSTTKTAVTKTPAQSTNTPAATTASTA
jgi:hypothetical protein